MQTEDRLRALRTGLSRWANSNRAMHPAQFTVLGFGIASVVGTILLMLPWSAASGEWTHPIDALFTAVSALCVTGLIVVDTPTYWSVVGQAIIMALIQLGGLGIMMFASLVGLVLVRKLSVRGRMNTAAEAKVVGLHDLAGLLRRIVTISLTVELVTFLILFPRLWLTYDHPAGEAAWQAAFHAVSAFNNAGFSLYSDSLMRFVADPVVCLTISVAIILGGIGFPVIVELRREWGRPLRWSMNTKLVLAATSVLLVGGTVYITAIEWNNPDTLGALDPWARVLAGFFQSVQTRTAGFNTIDIGLMRPESWVGMDALMFIGGGPAGTAGGIKVTTFAVLFFIILTELRGDGAVNIFGKRLSRSVHRQAITVVLLAVAAIFAVTIAIMLITGNSLDRVLFEAVSAFGTVGLSTGLTPDMPPSADLALIALMFTGRLGPLTLGSAIALRSRHALYELPKERPAIG